MAKNTPVRHPLEVTIDGKAVRGSYVVEALGRGRGRWVTVYAESYGTKGTQVGGMDVEDLARWLLHELATQAGR